MTEPARLKTSIENDTSILVYCNAPGCGHSAVVQTGVFLDAGVLPETPVPDLCRYLRCGQCGSRDVQSRPDPYPPGLSGVARTL